MSIRLLQRTISLHPYVTLGMLGASGIAFAALTADLYHTLHANMAFIVEHGMLAIEEGALWQLAGLLLSSVFGVAAYVVALACKQKAFPEPEVRTGMAQRIHRLLTIYWLLTLAIMGLSAVVFGGLTVNLYIMLNANIAFISEHGMDAIQEGALWQSLELLVYGVLAVIGYVLFKACEHVLVEQIADAR